MAEVSRSNIMPWTDSNILAAPETCGVYILRPADKTIGYIGMAGAGRLRERLQEHKRDNDHPLTEHFDWYQHDDEDSARAQERAWIDKHNPPWN